MSLKSKAEKEIQLIESHVESQVKSYQNSKEIIAQSDQKFKKLKKENDSYDALLTQLKNYLMEKVEERKPAKVPRVKTEYEAAKMLGLGTGELEEFLHPDSFASSNLEHELNIDWRNGDYFQFFETIFEFLLKK